MGDASTAAQYETTGEVWLGSRKALGSFVKLRARAVRRAAAPIRRGAHGTRRTTAAAMPRGRGTVEAAGTKAEGRWHLDRFVFVPEGDASRAIDLAMDR